MKGARKKKGFSGLPLDAEEKTHQTIKFDNDNHKDTG